MLVSGTKAYELYKAEAEALKKLQEEQQSTMNMIRNLETNKGENMMLLSELELLDSEAVIYKKTGAVLAKQDVDEALTDVRAKIKIIETEMERLEKQSKAIEEKMTVTHKRVLELRKKCPQIPYAKGHGPAKAPATMPSIASS